EEARELLQIDTGKNVARAPFLVLLAAQSVRRDGPLAPEPDFAHAELPVDLQLVDPARGPHHLDREVGPLGSRHATEDVALVELPGALDALVAHGPRAVRAELDAVLEAPHLDQAADAGLDRLVVARRAHDLDFPLEESDARRRPIAPKREQAL